MKPKTTKKRETNLQANKKKSRLSTIVQKFNRQQIIKNT